MQKSKLGVSVGLIGTSACLCGLFGWNVALVLIIGYVLLNEENEWLRKSVVKAGLATGLFALVSALIGILPDACSAIYYFTSAFGNGISVNFVSGLSNAALYVLSVLRCIVLAFMGLKSLGQGNVSFLTIDKLTDKHM